MTTATWRTSFANVRAADPDGLVVVVAEADGDVVCAAWMRFPPATEFATLWGGATAGRMARARHLPRRRRVPRAPRRAARPPLSPGRRVGRQPPDPRTARLRRGHDHDAVRLDAAGRLTYQGASDATRLACSRRSRIGGSNGRRHGHALGPARGDRPARLRPAPARRSRSIRRFVPVVIDAIGMVAHGPLALERFGDGELEGWSALQFIETSSITIHADEVWAAAALSTSSPAGRSTRPSQPRSPSTTSVARPA